MVHTAPSANNAPAAGGSACSAAAAGSWFDVLAEQAPFGLGVFDGDLRFVALNEVLARHSGLPRSVHLGRSITELFPATAAELAPLLRRVLETGEPIIGRAVALDFGSPEQTRLLVSYFRVELAPGRPGVASIVEEVAARERVEEQLELVADTVPAMISLVDATWRYRLVNRAFAEWLGQTREELVGCHVREALGDAAYEQMRPHAAAALGGTRVTFEREMTSPRGEPRWLHATYVPLHRDGAVQGFVALTQDITERKRAEKEREEALRKEQLARFAAERAADRVTRLEELTSALSGALDLAAVGQAILDHGSTALRADATGIFLLADDDAALELVAHRGISDDVVAALRSFPSSGPGPIASAARTGKPEWLETIDAGEARLPLAGPAGLEAIAALALRVEGRRLGSIAFGFHRPHAFPLEERSFALTLAEHCALAIDRARLHGAEQEARRAAEIANRAKDEFLTVLSHELRTPLTAILGWASILRTRKTDLPTLRRGLETIERNARVQARLVEDILDMSRIVTGKLRLSARAVDPVAIVRSALDVVRPSIEAKSLVVEEALDPGVGAIHGDPDRLQQIAWNLLSNAVKFTPKGGRIRVALERQSSLVRLVVADTGQGIAPEFLPHVFERFMQADASMSRAHGGLGLGLAIVKHLVDLHGGSITAESGGTGAGATFTVSLPAPAEEVIEERRASISNTPRPPAEIRLDHLRVLVVDDEPDALELIARILEDQGAEVTLAASTPEALAALERVEVDVLVSDIGMPGEDGYALLQRARALLAEHERYLPALALTAYAGAQDAKTAYRTGFQMHLAKPVAPGQLVEAVARLAATAGAR